MRAPRIYVNQREADALLAVNPNLARVIVVLTPFQYAERDAWVKSINSNLPLLENPPENPAATFCPMGLASHSKGR